MKELRYDLVSGSSVNRWRLTKVAELPYESPVAAFEAPVNLEEGYVQIVYPVREAFLKDCPIHKIGFGHMDGQDFDQVYFPFENNRVEFSTFLKTPHIMSFMGESYLEVDAEGEYQFELATCGGVCLWVNGEAAVTHTPYTRNISTKKAVTLHLKAGLNKLNVYADDLAERDVFFCFELKLIHAAKMEGVVMVEEDPGQIKIIEDILYSAHLLQDVYTDGHVEMGLKTEALESDLRLEIEGFHTLAGDPLIKELDVRPGDHHKELVSVEAVAAGVWPIYLVARLGSLVIKRKLLVGIIDESLKGKYRGETVSERKAEALRFLAENTSPNDQKALANLKLDGSCSEETKTILCEMIRQVNAREDCADFRLPTLIYIYKTYGTYLDDALKEAIKEAVLNFRFWIDEPGNDVMWYFSENHAMLFHVGQYLAGDLFPNEIFHNSGRRGEAVKALGKDRLLEWFDLFFRYGFAEWNSVSYLPVDLIGFTNLYLQAPDAAIKEYACKAMDLTFNVIHKHSFNGVLSSSYGRAYENSLKCSGLKSNTFFEWINTNNGKLTIDATAIGLYAMTDYEPDLTRIPDSIRVYEDEVGECVEMQQGIAKVNLYTYKTKDYLMSSAQRYKAFTHGHQQHMMNIAFGEKSAQFFINHPGELPPSGNWRPSYWAGNGTLPMIVQNRNELFMLYSIEDQEPAKFIHGYIMRQAIDEIKVAHNHVLLRSGDAYVGVVSNQQIYMTQEGANTNKEITMDGPDVGVYVKCGSLEEDGSFETFVSTIESLQVAIRPKEWVEVKNIESGKTIRVEHES